MIKIWLWNFWYIFTFCGSLNSFSPFLQWFLMCVSMCVCRILAADRNCAKLLHLTRKGMIEITKLRKLNSLPIFFLYVRVTPSFQLLNDWCCLSRTILRNTYDICYLHLSSSANFLFFLNVIEVPFLSKTSLYLPAAHKLKISNFFPIFKTFPHYCFILL